jgi:hypothetical protein
MNLTSLLADRVDIVETTSFTYWEVDRYNLKITGSEEADRFDVEVHHRDELTFLDADYAIMRGCTASDIVGLVALLDQEFTDAVEWIERDAVDGILGDLEVISSTVDIDKKTPVDSTFYVFGCGDIARNFDHDVGLTTEDNVRFDAHARTLFAKGLIGKGIKHNADGTPNKDAVSGFHYALLYSIDDWIRYGGLEPKMLGLEGPTI